jgi:hypothetical protein
MEYPRRFNGGMAEAEFPQIYNDVCRRFGAAFGVNFG